MTRPLVLVFTVISFAITFIFKADVDAQGGAYATGVLVLMTSASLAATLSARRQKQRFALWGFAIVTLVFVYTTFANVVERPDGVRIAAFFIAAILVVSISSRVRRSFQLRARSVVLDEAAYEMLRIDAGGHGEINLIAHENHGGSQEDYDKKARAERRYGRIPAGTPTIFLEVHLEDSSDFEEDLVVRGRTSFGHRVLEVSSSSIPNAIAAVMLAIRDEIGVVADQRGRPTYAPDLAQWIGVIGKRLIARDGALGIFHAANAEPASWADFAEAIFDGAARRGARVPETLRRITTADYPTPAARPANSVLSTSRLETEYDLTLRSWRPALADCLDQLIGPDPHSGKEELQ